MFGRRRNKAEDPTKDVEGTDVDSELEGDEHLVGPFDVDDAPDDGVTRLDLGSLRVPTPSGVEARMQTDDKGNVKQVLLVHADSALQLGVFAAPRSEGIWEEVRTEIRDSIAKQGGQIEEIDEGSYGVELVVRPAGAKKDAAVRFVGIDGPRWFVRGLFQGRRALDPEAAPLLDEVLRGAIVDRGKEAMPVREGLPLRLPANMAKEAKERMEQAKSANGAGPNGVNGAARSKTKPSPRPKK